MFSRHGSVGQSQTDRFFMSKPCGGASEDFSEVASFAFAFRTPPGCQLCPTQALGFGAGVGRLVKNCRNIEPPILLGGLVWNHQFVLVTLCRCSKLLLSQFLFGYCIFSTSRRSWFREL